MRLHVSDEEVEAMLQAKIDAEADARVAAVMERCLEAMVQKSLEWRSAAQIREEFGVPERTLRLLVQQRKVGKSLGLGKHLVKYSRPDILELLERGEIKSTTTLEREGRDKRKVTHFSTPPVLKAG